MRTLLVATTAFAALVIGAPVGHADGLSDLNARVQVAAKAAYADCVKKGDTESLVSIGIFETTIPNGYALAKKDAGLSDADAIQAVSPAIESLRNFCK
jgi:hypothetical protein